MALDVNVEGWTPEALVLWLDRQVHQPDIHQSELLKCCVTSMLICSAAQNAHHCSDALQIPSGAEDPSED